MTLKLLAFSGHLLLVPVSKMFPRTYAVLACRRIEIGNCLSSLAKETTVRFCSMQRPTQSLLCARDDLNLATCLATLSNSDTSIDRHHQVALAQVLTSHQEMDLVKLKIIAIPFLVAVAHRA